ncbi:hypothetical protein MERGE_000257 [Pneumocystis wakefieldiae]|uniref:Ribosomal RNA-processing protein 43 n=1 Tax=Pneumocystis wakefieldiae TaxID=38082 RepID=A0A899FVM7_9ASCO|nr:hypothetical protein MERGE_000257 [Pneumocystis wakefieldiae]
MAENTQLSFPPEVYKKINYRQYFKHFLSSSLRPDGRTFFQFRSTSINTGSLTNTNGSSIARMGDTIFVCGIQAEIAKPSIKNPMEGWIVPHVILSPFCSEKYRSGHNHVAQAISQKIMSHIQASNMLPLSSLLISKNKAAWILYADLICLNYDGNAMDVAWIALMSALETTKLPIAKWDEDTERVICEKRYKSLELNQRLFSMSFGVFDGKYILSDLCDDEENLIPETINIVMSNNKQLFSINKTGGTSMTQEMILSCIELAKKRYDELYDLVNKSK